MAEMIGPYRVEERLGVGGMGEVYKAYDDRLDRWVAIKRIRPDKETAKDHRERFQREARATARLNHSAIVHLYDIFQDGDSDCIVMEYVEGRSLDKSLLEGKLTPLKVANLGEEIASGLAEAHSKGILHRDLKVENIIVTPEGHAKILDFGLAKPMLRGDLDASLTGKGQLVGTSRAMAPEYVSGEAVDHRSDLFSLGVLLYEASTGHSPFKSHNTLATLKQVMLYRQTPAHQLNPQLPMELSDLIDRLLSKDPAERPYQAEDVARELQQIIGQLSSETVPRPSSGAVFTDGSFLTQSATATSLDLLSRRRWIVVAVVLAAVLGTAALLRWLSPTSKIEVAGPPSEPTFSIEERDRIVVGQFRNQTGEAMLDDSVNLAFHLGLEQSRYAQVLPDSQVREALQRMERAPDTVVDRELGIEICKREGAKALVTGSIIKIGDSYSLSAKIIDPQSAASIYSASEIAKDQSSIISGLDNLTREIRNELGESLPAIAGTTRLEKVTTSDLEALRAYSIGVRKATEDEFDEARQLFRRALEVDPEFGMAHAKLASLYIYERDYTVALEHLDRALNLSARLTGFERLYVEGWVARLRGTPEEVVQVWSLASSIYPDQALGHLNAGNAYFFLFNQFDKAAEFFEKAARVAGPDDRVLIYTQLGYMQLALGQNEKALKSFESIEMAERWTSLADYHLLVENHREAKRLLEQKTNAPLLDYRVQSRIQLAPIFADQGDLQQAKRIAGETLALARELGLEREELTSTAVLTALAEQTDSKEAFKEALAAAMKTAERILDAELERLKMQETAMGGLHRFPVRTLALMAKLSARNSSVPIAESMRKKILLLAEERGLPIWLSHAKMLAGEIAVARGDLETARGQFNEANSAAEFFQVHESLARTHELSGNTSAAITEYRWMVEHRGRALMDCYEGCQAVTFLDWNLALYRLGKLYAEEGKTEQAATYLRRFLDRWQPNGEVLPVGQEARRLIETLD